MKENQDYTSSNGNLIRISVFGEEDGIEKPWIVCFHGFKGFKDWGFFPFAGEYFASRGFGFVTVNFSHNGVGEDLLNFTRPDLFAENTLSLELEESLEIIEVLASGKLLGFPIEKIGVLGHSRGGGIAILSSHFSTRVSAVCTWASVANYLRFLPQQTDSWKKNGFIEVPNARTGQVFRMNYSYCEDLLANGSHKLNILKAVEKLRIPLCIIHGDRDEAVPLTDGQAIFEQADASGAEFHQIKETGHTFGAKHPFEGSNPHLDLVLEHTISFFERNLK